MTDHRFLGIIFAAFLVGCVTRSSENFSVSGTQTQHVALGSQRQVLIRCYCPNRFVTADPNAKTLKLQITANHSSVGYHGTQSKPTALGNVRFVERPHDDALKLESREYTYIHHALIVTDIRIVAPVGVNVRFESIEIDKLQGR